MLQFYFLSVLMNIMAGLILVYATNFFEEETPASNLNSENSSEEEFSSDDFVDTGLSSGESSFSTKGTFFDDLTFRLVVAVLSGLVGLMKLLSTVQNDIPVIGDLIPAFAGFSACAALLLEYYAKKSVTAPVFPSFAETLFVDGRKYIGVFCILAGVLHFIFPRVLFL